MSSGRLSSKGSHLVLGRERFPEAFRHEPASGDLVAVLYDQTPDEWRRAWRTDVGWIPEREVLLDVTALARGTAATPATGMVPGRDIVLRTLQRPVGGDELVEAIETYLATAPTARTTVFLDAFEEFLDDVGVDVAVTAATEMVARVDEANARAVFCLDPDEVHDDHQHRIEAIVDEVHGHSDVDKVTRLVRTLREEDPTNYGYVRRHWEEARVGIESCCRNYPQARQIHAAIENPSTTPRTLGAALKALVTLDVIDTWSETVGSTRYDLTTYDAALLERVGEALDAAE